MSDLTRIQKASTRFRKFFIGIMIILPLIPVIVWIFFNDLPGFLRQIILSELKVPFVYNMELTTRLLACTASLIPTAVTLTGFYYLIKLFKLYEKGQIFLTENVACYRKLGYVLIVSMVTGIVHSSLMSMILSMQNPPGQRILRIGFGSDDITKLVIGLLIILVSWIMNEGRELQEEQQYTV